MNQARYQKNLRERQRKAKAAAKRERRAARAEDAANTDAEGTETDAPAEPQADVLAELAKLHEQFEAKAMTFEEFEERKQELVDRLAVE